MRRSWNTSSEREPPGGSIAVPGSAAAGARVCRAITREHARTFYFASHGLPRRVRRHAYNVYGFCRWADDGVDHAPDRAEAARRIERARRALRAAYDDGPAPDGLLALRRTIRERLIPIEPFEALLDGMAMDLDIHRYDNFHALEIYCYRVAGVVGLLMAHVFGFRHPRCLPHAIALGNAMQLTNILRDVGEDLGRGRVYLPGDELKRFGVDEDQLRDGRVDANFRALMAFQIERARRLYRDSEAGVPDLIGASSRLTVRLMGRLYGGILAEIEALDYDVFRTRARVSGRRKLAGFARLLMNTGLEELRDFAR